MYTPSCQDGQKSMSPVSPKIEIIQERDSAWIESCLDSYCPNLALGKFLLNRRYWLTNQNNFLNTVAWDWVDSKQYLSEEFDDVVAPDLAWAMGLFFADGTCGLRSENYSGAYWNICNTNPELLEGSVKPLEIKWPGLSFKIETYPSEAKGKVTNYGVRRKSLYHLLVGIRERHNNGDRGRFIREWLNLFYFNGYKRVPAPLMGSSTQAKRQFLLGAIAGDAYIPQKGAPRLGVRGRIGLSGLLKLGHDINWSPSFYPEERRTEFYYVCFNWRQQYDPLICEYLKGRSDIPAKQIADFFGISNSCLYSILNRLESNGFIKSERPWAMRRNVTLTHELPNQCKDSAIAFKFHVDCSFGLNQVGIVLGYESGQTHSVVIFPDRKIMLVEPQTDELLFITDRDTVSHSLQNSKVVI